MLFENATRNKVRFLTEKGNITIEDLWDLPLKELNKIAKSLNQVIKNLDEEDFLEDSYSKEDDISKLKFDVVLYILKTKKQEFEDFKDLQNKKLEKEKLLNIISKKQDESLENLSVEELKERLEKI